jgi:hypothetical protein
LELDVARDASRETPRDALELFDERLGVADVGRSGGTKWREIVIYMTRR